MNEKFDFNDSNPQIPAAALCFNAECELAERSSDGNDTATVRLRARSGDPVDHWYFGKIAHDLDGYELTGDKNKVSILYEHKVPVGYALRKNVREEDGDLVVSGTLVNTRHDDDMATRVADWMAGGIPFESSISFAGGKPDIEKVPEKMTAEVNGKTFEGPGVIVRKWKLREVSIVTSGADDDTESALFNQSETVSVNFIEPEKETDMSDTNSPAVEDPKQLAESVDTTADLNSSEDVAATVTESVEEQKLAEVLPAQRYFDAFGEERGSWYFAHGVPFDDALAQEIKKLRAVNEHLSSKVDAQATAGHEDALAASAEPKNVKPGRDDEGKLTDFPVTFANPDLQEN